MAAFRKIPVTLQWRGAIGGAPPGKDSVVGPGARPVRAGSIGRDTPGQAELAELPPQKAGSVSPALSIRKSVPHDSKRTGLAPGPWVPLAFTPNLSSSDLGHPLLTEWLPFPLF